MSIFKCKMCGGTIEFEQGATVGVCDSCGTKQTLAKTGDDAIVNLFNRANNLRLKAEFDKAASIYEKIIEQDDSEAEAHWGVVLCKYGIEYVNDPATGEKIPTCHRTLLNAVTTDPDYQATVDYSDSAQREIYKAEARAIDRIQKDILNIAKNEKYFDVFICYKETDENGDRTRDSALANDIYYQLTQEGFKVFFAAITLEDKLGQEYEPYIFAALNSAKVMLVIGTKPEYFDAVWVRNEWSRFLQLMKNDRSKSLIPCYRDMDAYELPEEFSHLQAQNMSKIGFVNDLVRGIKKMIGRTNANTPTEKQFSTAEPASFIVPLLERAFLFLEDKKWDAANEYCEKVLDRDPKCASAYVCKLMAELFCSEKEELCNCKIVFEQNDNYKKAMRFGDDKLKNELKNTLEEIKNRKYQSAVSVVENNDSSLDALDSARINLLSLGNYRDAEEKLALCLELIKAQKIFEYEYVLSEKKATLERLRAKLLVPWISVVSMFCLIVLLYTINNVQFTFASIILFFPIFFLIYKLSNKLTNKYGFNYKSTKNEIKNEIEEIKSNIQKLQNS